MQEHTDGVPPRVPKAIRLRLPVEQNKDLEKTDTTLPLSNRCRETDNRESELEAQLRNLILLSRHLTENAQPTPTERRSTTKLHSFQSESHPVPRGPTDPAGSIIKRQTGDIIINNREQTDNTVASDRSRNGQTNVPPSPLCPTVGARSHQISQGVYVHVLTERIEEEIEEEAGRGPSSPETNSMAGRVRVFKECPPLSQRAEKMQCRNPNFDVGLETAMNNVSNDKTKNNSGSM